jgi:hypothetical protein
MLVDTEYQISPLKGLLKNKIISKQGPDEEILTTALKFGFISRKEFKVLQAIKQKKEVKLSSEQLKETLKRLHTKNLVEKIE